MFNLHFRRKNNQEIQKKTKKESSGAVKEFIAKLSRGLMLPIAMLPIAGLFLGIGSAITSQAGDNEYLRIFGNVIKEPGDVIFGNLAVLFAIAIAITFTGDVGVAGLSSFVGWIVFCALQNALIIPVYGLGQDHAATSYQFLFWNLNPTMFGAVFTTNVGIQSLCTSVFGGLTVGFVVAILYNKFKNIQLPTVLGFFSGIRFIPIITFVSMIPLSFFFSLIWPAFGMGLYYVGYGLGVIGSKTGGFNSFIFGFIERSLVPFGLHHAFYTPLWYTSVGGQIQWITTFQFEFNDVSYRWMNVLDSKGSIIQTFDSWAQFLQYKGFSAADFPVQGDQSCWMVLNQIAGTHVQLVDATTEETSNLVLTYDVLCKSDLCNNSVNAGQYMQGKYAFMMFGLPAAAAAMIMVTPKGQNRKVAFSIIGSAALTSFLTGITEPLEFTFLFLAPWLYWGFHAFFCAMSFWMMNLFGAHMGMTFSGGFLDFIIYGALPDGLGAGSRCWVAIIIGLVLIPIYFFGFYFLIKKFNIKTPGREGTEVKLMTKKDYLASKQNQGTDKNSEINILANKVIAAYGGKENIKNVDACITKLRVQVADPAKTNKEEIMALGARGVMYPSKQSVYAVFGTQADRIKNEMKAIISGSAPTIDLTANSQPESIKKATMPITKKIDTKKLNKKVKQIVICAPANGEVISTKEVKDETFSQDIMGKGFAIVPTDGLYVAPIAGKIALIENHAFAIETPDGIQVLVHIGIDTVKLAGKNVFKHFVAIGQEVKVGDKIVQADLAKIKKAKLSTATPVIALNETIENKQVIVNKTGKVKAGTEIVSIK